MAPQTRGPRRSTRHPLTRRLRFALPLLLLCAALANTLNAQERTLAQAEARFDTGDYDAARSLLDEWWAFAPDADGRLRARALLLRAKLTTELRAAERDYLAIVLGHPATPQAPDALIRLGQMLLADGQTDRAIAYLERLIADYPGAEQRAHAFLWLARAQRVAGRTAVACATLERAPPGLARDPRFGELLLAELSLACQQHVDPAPHPTPPAQPSATGPYAIQLGAFGDTAPAEALARQLQVAGFQPRIVTVAGTRLFRVRVGRGETIADVAELSAAAQAAGFAPAVVQDADRERHP